MTTYRSSAMTLHVLSGHDRILAAALAISAAAQQPVLVVPAQPHGAAVGAAPVQTKREVAAEEKVRAGRKAA